MSQTAAPISGSTTDCLKHFSEHNPSAMVVGELTKFTDVKPPAVMEWLDGGRFPRGLELIKLRAFLVQAGYDVREFTSMPEDNQRFCLMVGFGVLDIDEVRRRLEYKDPQGVLDLALRSRGVFNVRANEFDLLLRTHQDQLDAAIETFQQQMGRTGRDLQPPPPAPAPPVRKASVTPDDDHRLVVALAHNLHTASWLAEIVDSWGDSGRELLGGVLSDREMDLIISRILKLRGEEAAQSTGQ